ncbi:hypothetical protein FQR65_LT14866 [Abscondita terminalis]|nr:hypothetical protein FQR65_LT14866 [Abscondita terminalis]
MSCIGPSAPDLLSHGGNLNFDDLNDEIRHSEGFQAYSDSKLANILFTKELARRLQDANIENVNVYSLHPGMIATDIARHLGQEAIIKFLQRILYFLTFFIFKTPEQGAQTTIHCAVDENAGKETGLYYSECQVREPASNANSIEDAEKLWELSIKFVGLEKNYDIFSRK